MRVAKFLLNTLLFGVMFVVILFAQWGITSVVSLQDPDSERIVIAPKADRVSYLDAAGFLAEDLKAGYAQEDYYLVRNWLGFEWWKNGTAWADVAISKIVVTAKAVFVPVLDIKDMKTNRIEGYDVSWNDFGEGWLKVIKSPEYLKIVEGMDEVSKASYNMAIAELLNLETTNQDKWVSNHKQEYKFIRLSQHYNTPEMQKYFEKFIGDDGKIKFATISIYAHFIITLILAGIFVHNNKFTLRRNEDDNENEVGGGISFPGFRKKNKKKNRNKQK